MIAFPAVILFGVVSALLIRSRTIRPLEAVIVGLFGFFLAATGLGHGLGVFLDDVFASHHSAPAAPAQPGSTASAPPGPLQPGRPGQTSSGGV